MGFVLRVWGSVDWLPYSTSMVNGMKVWDPWGVRYCIL